MGKITMNIFYFLISCSFLPKCAAVFDKSERSDDAGALQIVVDQLSQKVTAMETKIQALETSNYALQNGLHSSYTRWGRTQCPSGTETIYSGFIGGSWFEDPGRAVNYLCLTKLPVYDSVQMPSPGAYAKIMGTEYERFGLQDLDAVCAVCRPSRPTSVMIPATNVCPSGWTVEYSGHIAAGRFHDKVATEYICLDGSPESAEGGQSNLDGALLYLTISECGSLHCPPFQNNGVVTCVVCSK